MKTATILITEDFQNKLKECISKIEKNKNDEQIYYFAGLLVGSFGWIADIELKEEK